MRGKITFIVIVSVVVYLLLAATLYFGSVFVVSWGGESRWYVKAIVFMQNIPISLTSEKGEITMNLVFINALFWTLCIAALLYFFTYLLSKNR